MVAKISLVKHEFRALGTQVEFLYPPQDGAQKRVARAERWLHAFEQRLSRFQTLSELSRLNRSSGRPFRASPLLFSQVALAIDLARRSGGLFDPTILGQLEGAGYDRSFELISDAMRAAAGERQADWRAVGLDRATRTVLLPEGLGIDLGGVAKGWAVDRLAAILGCPALTNAGGDIYAAGAPPGGPAWLVSIEDPLSPERDVLVLGVKDRGVATSSTVRRRWKIGERWAHHLIDPRTGRPSESDVIAATVIASKAYLADYHAKVALLLGRREGLDYLNREREIEGLLVERDGGILKSRSLSRYLTP